MKELREKLRRELKAARDIAAKCQAEGRGYTPAERAVLKNHLVEANKLRAEIARRDGADSGLKTALKELGDDLAGIFGDGPSGYGLSRPSNGSWSAKVYHEGAVAHGRKDLVAGGSVLVPPAYDASIASTEPMRPRFVQDLIPSEPLREGNAFSFMRQTVRTNNAAPVAPGALKPTSVYTVSRVEATAKTIAHLSEPIKRQDLADAAFMRQFLEDELRYGLVLEVDDQVLNGDGTGENFEGVHTVSGTIVQAFVTDIFTTTRKALTPLSASGVVPNAWVVHPNDWETIELQQDNEGLFYMSGTAPVDRARHLLWGLPVVESPAQPEGEAVVGDWRAAVLRPREEAVVDWSENVYDSTAAATDFERNLVRFRAEQRIGFAVLRPASFAIVDLTV